MAGRRVGAAGLGAALVAGLLTGCEAPAPPPSRAQIYPLDADGLDSGARYPVFSEDGTQVAFRSARQIVPEDTNPWEDIYVRDLATGATELVTATPAGTSSAESPDAGIPVFSEDGTKIVFLSAASDLVPDDGNGYRDVFVRDLATDTTTLVSVDASGTGGGNQRSGPAAAISPDGTKVAFQSLADNFGPADVNNVDDVYVRDLTTQTTSLASVGPDGTAHAQSSRGPLQFGPDGDLLFLSAASLTDAQSNSSDQVYIRDLAAGVTTLVSVSTSGGVGSSNASAPTFSPDGTEVAFVSIADDLVSTDTNGVWDVFVRDLASGTTELVSVNAAGDDSGDGFSSRPPVFSPDGSKIAFASLASDLTADDPEGPDTQSKLDVYVRDLASDTTNLVTVTARGDAAAGDSRDDLPAFDRTGTRVAFVSSARSFGPADTNRSHDVYVRDLAAGTTSLVSARADGTDAGNASSDAPTFAPDGRIVFSSAARDLDPRQTPTSRDLYAASPPATADLAVTLAAEGPVAADADATFAAHASNGGPDAATAGSVAVLLPDDTTFVGATASAGTCVPPTAEQPRLVVCDVGDLPDGASAEVRVTSHVTAAEGATLRSLAGVSSDVYDPDGSDNLARLEVTVAPPESLGQP